MRFKVEPFTEPDMQGFAGVRHNEFLITDTETGCVVIAVRYHSGGTIGIPNRAEAVQLAEDICKWLDTK